MEHTFASQSAIFLKDLQRRSNPVKASTLATWTSVVNTHVLPALGSEPLGISNLKLKQFASNLRSRGLAAKTIHEVVRVVKGIIASAVDPETGDSLYSHSFNMKFIDLPRIEAQRSPTIDAKTIDRLLRERKQRYAVLYALLAGTGLRISEALALRIGDDSLRNAWDAAASVIHIRNGLYRGAETSSPKTRAAVRSVDVHPKLNQVLQAYAVRANRKPGSFLFATRTDRPVSDVMVRRDLTSAGVTCGLHAFRRFRISQCRRARVSEDVLRFWVGHASRSLTDHYAKSLAEDLELRKVSVLQAGLGFNIDIDFPAQLLLGNINQTQTEVT